MINWQIGKWGNIGFYKIEEGVLYKDKEEIVLVLICQRTGNTSGFSENNPFLNNLVIGGWKVWFID